jgi:hypothetical protein
MNKVILQSLISFVVAVPLGIFVIRLLLKRTILSKVLTVWLFSLVFVVLNARISAGLPDVYPYYVSMPIAIIVMFFVAYSIHLMLGLPLKSIIDDLK